MRHHLIDDLVAAIAIVAAIAGLALAPPARADETLSTTDGRQLTVVTASAAARVVMGVRIVSADVLVSSGTVRVSVAGCDGSEGRLLTYSGRTPLEWAPGGLRLLDLLAESICNAGVANLR